MIVRLAIMEPATTDTLGRRRRLHPVSTGKRVTPQPRDLLWFEFLHRHGPLPSSYLHAYTASEWRSDKRARERLTDLFNEAETPHGGPYLTRPMQQFRTIDSRYNELVYDLASAARQALRAAGRWRADAARPSGPWLHAHLVACVTASIELATLARDDLTFIPGWRVLTRAQTELRCPVSSTDPATGQTSTKDLIPDALFGLEYQGEAGSRFRFFVVEADRATEPVTSGNWNRKSAVRNFRQYAAYIGGGVYREHMQLTAPLLVLNVTTAPARAQKMQATLERSEPRATAYQLFQNWAAFGAVWRPQPPRPALLHDAWERAGRDGFRIDQV